jgi:Na+/H+ antiporter NhaD/arsenite permease-like protein
LDLLGVPLEFFVFAVTLAAIALFHRFALQSALAGLACTVALKLFTLGGPDGLGWLSHHFAHEWPLLANLFLLLIGFAVLANHFELSDIPDSLPPLLPQNGWGGIILLGIVFVMSIFLDNIAAAIIGGVMAKHVYRGRVGTGYLAAIVAAANAGGAGSVIGDTTTTMMWITGIPPWVVASAFMASLAAFVVFAPLAALQQQRFRPAQTTKGVNVTIDWPRGIIVLLLLLSIMAINVAGNAWAPSLLESGPWLGVGLWIVILLTAAWRRPDWSVVSVASSGAIFLVALVAIASMMPVDNLPGASWQTALGLGFLSAVFDNIPLTALALKQGGYDWGILAYAVGFGGSMVWFGSSAGVALSNLYPNEVRTLGGWLRFGWFVPVAYFVGFFALLLAFGWRPG